MKLTGMWIENTEKVQILHFEFRYGKKAKETYAVGINFPKGDKRYTHQDAVMRLVWLAQMISAKGSARLPPRNRTTARKKQGGKD